MNLEQYDYFLVLDLEATCCDKGTIKRHEMEIIEIGAVMVEAQALKIINEFQTFIKPVRYPILTDFCKALTSINQAQVNGAPGYVEAIALLKRWLSNYPNAVFGSWGDYEGFATPKANATSSNKIASSTTFLFPLPILTSISNNALAIPKAYPSDTVWLKP